MARTNYLPLGSVVLLNNGVQKVMIIGRALNVNRGGKEFYFDYGGVLHPQGLINNEMAYFNHEDVNTVYFTGYNDEGIRDLTEVINNYVEEHPDLNRCTPEEWEEAGKDEE